jgi:hypothetical protein
METTNNNTPAITTNYIVTKGSIWDQLQYSLFKLLDWSIGSAVCVSVFDDGTIFINDCKSSLRKKLLKEIGGITDEPQGRDWLADDNTDICAVLKVVTDWINQQ